MTRSKKIVNELDKFNKRKVNVLYLIAGLAVGLVITVTIAAILYL